MIKKIYFFFFPRKKKINKFFEEKNWSFSQDNYKI